MRPVQRAWLVLGLLGSCSLSACGDERAPEPAPDAATWLSQLRSAHPRADAALSAGNVDDAVAVLAEAGRAPMPAELLAADRRVLHQDLLYRLGGAELDRAEPARALAAAERGLGLGRAQDVFTANLLVVRGEALQALERETEAAASYFEALEINRALLAQVLDETSPPVQDAQPPSTP